MGPLVGSVVIQFNPLHGLELLFGVSFMGHWLVLS
jgi:hypothetical protein